jgi:hypothetical protein
MSQSESAVPGLHDFDFLVGHWQVHHRKLKQRLANVEFEGTLFSQPLMRSYSNVDDLALNVPGVPYRGVALRSFDPKTQQWSIWWLVSRKPSEPLSCAWGTHSSWHRACSGSHSSASFLPASGYFPARYQNVPAKRAAIPPVTACRGRWSSRTKGVQTGPSAHSGECRS